MNKKLFWIYILSASIYFIQGIEGMPGMALFFYLKEKLHFNPSTIMYIGSLTGLAWLIKPVWGYCCDNYFTKKKWIILSLSGSLGICFYLGLSSLISIPILIVLLSIANLTTAFRDVATDGIMCVEGKEANECGRIQAIQWTSITIASIIVGLVGGYVADHCRYQLAYLFLIPIYLIIIGIVLRYKPVQKLDNIITKQNKISISKIDKIRIIQFAGFCLVIFLSIRNFKNISLPVNIITFDSINNGLWLMFLIYITYIYYHRSFKHTKVFKGIMPYKELFTNKKFLMGCLFVFLYNFNPSFGTPLAFIERDIFKWSGTFMGILSAISSSIGITGSILYFKYGKQINIKKILYWSVFLGAITTLSYLYFTPISAIIYSFIYSIVGMFIFLNIMSWMAKSTINGKEATSFALLCSINNLAGTLSGLSGAWLFSRVGLSPLIIISALTSFFCLPLIKYIGDKK